MRPEFNQIKSYEEFDKYYWYCEELKQICKNLGLDSSGYKKELNDEIRQYFQGNAIGKKMEKTQIVAETERVKGIRKTIKIETKKAETEKSKTEKSKTQNKQRRKRPMKAPAPDVPLLECGFSFGNKFRAYFSGITGVKNFKFSADMVAAWRKVKKNEDMDFTVQDMLDVYYKKSEYARYDKSSLQWNQFVRDFCADEQNRDCRNKLKAASVLWKIVRESTQPKVYDGRLVSEHYKEVKEYY